MRRKENSSRKETNLGENQNARKYQSTLLIEQDLSGSEISPKYNAGLGKTPNVLTGYGISGPLVGKRDALKSWHGMRN